MGMKRNRVGTKRNRAGMKSEGMKGDRAGMKVVIFIDSSALPLSPKWKV